MADKFKKLKLLYYNFIKNWDLPFNFLFKLLVAKVI